MYRYLRILSSTFSRRWSGISNLLHGNKRLIYGRFSSTPGEVSSYESLKVGKRSFQKKFENQCMGMIPPKHCYVLAVKLKSIVWKPSTVLPVSAWLARRKAVDSSAVCVETGVPAHCHHQPVCLLWLGSYNWWWSKPKIVEIHIGRILFTINLYRFIYIYTFITNCGSSYVVGWEAMDGVLQEADSDLVYKVNRRDVGVNELFVILVSNRMMTTLIVLVKLQ